MMKRIIGVVLAAHLLAMNASAQDNPLKEKYEAFRKQARQDYEDFREQANWQYADFVEQAWKQYRILPAVPRPHEEKVQPVVFGDKEKDGQNKEKPRPDEEEDKNDNGKIVVRHDKGKKSVIEKEIVIDEIIALPEPEPQPKPVCPIKGQEDDGETLAFGFFGSECRVRIGSRLAFRLEGTAEKAVAAKWKQLSSSDWNNAIRDCLAYRIRYDLCDWGYLLMLDCLAQKFCGAGSNEATLLMAFIYCQSGYKMRLASSGGKLFMLYASKHQIYGKPYYSIGGESFYPYGAVPQSLYVCEASFPSETPLSLLVEKEQKLGGTMSEERTLQAKGYPEVCITVRENKDLMSFYETYPASKLGSNDVSRWAMYANTPICERTKAMLYPALKQFMEGKTVLQKVSLLLNWVQTAFVYAYDDEVWGGDRAFFADETLYYPYCDCEDRSILFSRLVRDLAGLDVALVYYPGHLAAAVRFPENVGGDCLLIDGERYTIADPTYIGAPVGATMPGMDNRTAKVIVCRRQSSEREQ